MNREDFLNMIESRSPVDRRMLGEVYDLINIFPYFHSAHKLLLKSLQDNNDVKFENQLKSSAIHIPDRELLYHYLRSEPSVLIPPAEVLPSPAEVLPTPAEEETVEIETLSAVHVESENSSILILEPESDEVVTTVADDDLLELIGDDEIFEEAVVPKPDEDLKYSRKQRQADLIDKFIITNPRIEPSREKTDLPVEDLSKSSTDESGVFVTDTLAQIYVHQGYYSKAIDIYEKLSLKFPEKSSYFATQIEKVKEYLKK